MIKISNQNSTIVDNVLIEFRIIITILQKIDFFAQKWWFYVARSTLMKRNKFEITTISVGSGIQNSKQSNAMNANDFIKFSVDSQNAKTNTNNWKIQKKILCHKNRWYISFDLLKNFFLKRNQDDSNTNHVDFKRSLKIIHRKWYWFRMSINI